MTAFADELYAKLSSIDAPSDDLAAYCDAVGSMFAEVEVYVRQTTPDDPLPWQSIMDASIANVTALLWLAQLAGVRVPVGTESDVDNLRAVVEAAEGRRRGTPDYMAEVAARFLTGTKSVAFFERYGGDAYVLHIVTHTSETPDENAVRAALLAVKPAGIVLEYEVADGITWDEPTHTWSEAGTTRWEDTFTTTP